VVALVTFPALGGVLYSSIPSLNVPPDGNVFGIGPGHFVLDKFSLESISTITEVKLSVESDDVPSEGLSELGILFWTDNGGMPGTELFGEGFGPPGLSYSDTDLGTTIVTAPFFAWLTLSAGNYWIGFSSLDLLGIPGYAGGSGDLVTVSTPFPYTFVPTGDSAGFTILGGLPGVPEPSTWAMLLLGFVGLGVAGHNHRLYAERAASLEFDRRHKPRAASLFFSSRLSSRIAGSRDLQSCALDIVSH
jgi:hypothetical protein